MNKQLINLSLAVSLSIVGIVSCKKDKNTTPEIIANQPPASGTRDELSKDSLYFYAQQVYLWNDALPTYDVFKPRGYISESNIYDNLNSELFAITQIPINPATGKSYEYIANANGVQIKEPKYSYIEDLIASGKITFANNLKGSVGLDGKGNDFGLGGLRALTPDRINYTIYLRAINPGSPAEIAGLKRGFTVDQINGRTISSKLTDDELDFINSSLDTDNKSSVALSGIKPNGTRFTVTLNKSQYNSSPIYKDSILTVGTKKVGYLAYARFSSSDNSQAILNATFSKFAAQNVENLIIDLRYNGGGFVSTAQQIINLIAPSSINGKTMFSLTYNTTMQQGKATILKNQPNRDQTGKITSGNQFQDDYSLNGNTVKIQKSGTLNNVTKVVFITTSRTASASELVINSLKPYLDVKIVGSTSFGKPVGFFPIRIDKYDVYLSSFYSTNSLGQGNYFAGFAPDSPKIDDVSKDFGDGTEISLAAALAYINTGVFTNSTSKNTITLNSIKTQANQLTIKTVEEPNSFTGMIDDLHKK